MNKRITASFILFFLLISCGPRGDLFYERSFYIMGSVFEYKLYCRKRADCDNVVIESQKRLNEIDRIFSNYRDDSVLAKVNSNAGKRPVKVPREFINLVKTSISFSKATGGLFDISVGYLFELWKKSAELDKPPTDKQIALALNCVGYDNIEIDETESTIFFKSDCLRLDFGAIGKGYSVDEVAKIVAKHRITKALLNFSGNILAVDFPTDPEGWEVGIKNPFNTDQNLETLKIHDLAVATSGDYEKNFRIKGKTYSHIINPISGLPSQELSSITVFANTATGADAFSTAFAVMGLEGTKHYLRNNSNVAVYAVWGDKSDIKTYKSLNFSFLEN